MPPILYMKASLLIMRSITQLVKTDVCPLWLLREISIFCEKKNPDDVIGMYKLEAVGTRQGRSNKRC